MRVETKPIKAVLFDLDDTLFDHQHCMRSGLFSIHNEYKSLRPWPLRLIEQENLRLRRLLHPMFASGAMSLQEVRVERFRQLFAYFGEQVSENTAEAALARFQFVYRSASRPIDGAITLLEKLRATVKIVVVTNHMLQEQREKLQTSGLNSLVDELVVSEEVGSVKPDPAIFHEALERVGCKSSEAVMVGDFWETDILGAHRASIRPIWFNRDGSPCPDPTIAHEINSYQPLDAVCDLVFSARKQSAPAVFSEVASA